MKKFAKIMAVMMLVALTVTALVACGYPADPAKAQEQLEKKGYTVIAVVGGTDAAGKISQAALDIQGAAYGVKAGELVATVSGTKVDTDKKETSSVSILYFSSADAANTAWESDIMKEARETAKENGQSIKKSGKQIYSEGVVKDSSK